MSFFTIPLLLITTTFPSSISADYSHNYEAPPTFDYHHQLNQVNQHLEQGLEHLGYGSHPDPLNSYHQHHQQDGYPTGPPPPSSEMGGHPYQEHHTTPPSLSHSASSCLSRIRLAASFDPSISSQINRFIDSMRIDRLRAFVCEKTAYFCDESQQKEVGEVFHQYEKSIEIIDQVRHQLTSTEKDQLNMMENLNDTLAEQAFFIYKFHQLNPVDLAILTSAKASLTSALSSNTPDAGLSKAVGTFSPQDLERISTLPISSLSDEVQSHLARCQISSPEVIHDTVAFLLSLMGSKGHGY